MILRRTQIPNASCPNVTYGTANRTRRLAILHVSCLGTGEGALPIPAALRNADEGCSCTDASGRVCPGRHFADDSLFINIALVLHVFSITPPLDEAGKAITIEPRMTNGFVS